MNREQADVGAAVERVVAGSDDRPRERQLVGFEAAADDIEPDRVIGEVDDQRTPDSSSLMTSVRLLAWA